MDFAYGRKKPTCSLEETTVKTQKSAEEFQKERSLKYFHCEAVSAGVEEAGNAYQSASMVAAGSSFQGVGVLSSLTNLVTAFLYLQVPSIVRRLGSRKRAIVVLSFLDAFSWLPLIVVLMWFRHISTPLLISLWIINLVPGMLVGAARNSWLADLTTAGSRGRYLGIRSSILNATYLTSFYIMGYILQLSGERIFTGFALVFLIAFAATAFSFLVYTRILEPRNAPREGANFGFVDFLRETSRRNLGRFILFASLFNFTVFLAAPFFAVYMLEDLRFSYVIFAVVSSSELAAKIVAVTFWGKYADRAGNLRILGIAAFSIPVVPILWLVSHNVAYLVMAQLFSGIMWAGFDLCVISFIYGAAPPEKRLRYIVYHQTLSKLSMALGTLTGVFLLTHITPIMGSRILALFLLSGLLRFAVVATIFPKLREVRKGVHTYQDELKKVPAMAWAVAANGGLLYKPRQWLQLSKQSPGQHRPRQVAADVASKLGLFYRPRQWQWFTRQATAPQNNQTPAEIAPNRGLFYKPRDWSWFGKQLAVAPVISPVLAQMPDNNRGLFYRPREWAAFGRQS